MANAYQCFTSLNQKIPLLTSLKCLCFISPGIKHSQYVGRGYTCKPKLNPARSYTGLFQHQMTFLYVHTLLHYAQNQPCLMNISPKIFPTFFKYY